MLRDALFIGWRDVRNMLRARETIAWVFVMPIVFFYFIGTVTAGFGGSGGGLGRQRLLLERGDDAGFLADEVELRLDAAGFDLVRPADLGEDAAPSRRLSVPAGFTADALAGRQATLELRLDRGELGAQYDEVRVRRAAYTVLADLVAAGETTAAVDAAAVADLRTRERTLSLDVRAAGERQRVPTGYEQTIPGTLVMFVLLVMTTSGAVLLVVERRQGLLRRLAHAPISRGSVVLGKWGGKLALGVVQIAFGMLVGTVVFGMDWGDNLGAVLLVLLAYGAMMASLGLLLGCVARTEGQAVGIGVLSANVLAALGGCWWPIEVTPDFLQRVADFLPTGWAMDALHRLVSFGQGPAAVAPHVLGMTAAAAVLGIAAARAFRYE